MKHIYEGKTKSVYQLEDGNILLKFKDDATGSDGVFDPGANTVGLTIEGMGRGGLRLTEHFFKKIEKEDIPTHFVSVDIENSTMTVRQAASFGNGVEVICRFRAIGSFLRRYGMYVKDGQPLNALVEFTLKDDERNDPLITKESLEALDIISFGEYEALVLLAKRISLIVRREFHEKGAELYDIKLEFGRLKDGQVVLIDEISGGNMRVYKDGRQLGPLEIVSLILG